MTDTKNSIYFSFFMFTADLRPQDSEYSKILIQHLNALDEMGYTGYDMHVANPSPNVNYAEELDNYRQLKERFNQAGFSDASFNTNVGSTPTFDPTSPWKDQRCAALEFLKSRVDITSALGGPGAIMSGPFLYPYGNFPRTDNGESLWSDALQDWMIPRYKNAIPVFQELMEYSQEKEVILAIEPIKNWESPPPNMVSEILDFVETVDEACPIGVALDTAQSVMESQGPNAFRENVLRATAKNRLLYVHISAPDRGKLTDCWIPWDVQLAAIKPVYSGPYLVEVFNAIEPFVSSMRMTRRRFWRPGEDPESNLPSAYDVARDGIAVLKSKLNDF